MRVSKGKKLSISDINRNSSIDIEHTIRKIKEKEFRHTMFWFFVFLFTFISTSLIVGCSFKKISNYNEVNSNNLIIEFDNHENVLDDVITLDNNSVLSYDDGLNSRDYNFKIINKSDTKTNYIIKLVDDYSMIEYDECYDMLFDKKNMFFSLNDKIVGIVSDMYNGNDYVIYKDSINGGESLDFKFKIWVDKKYITNGHYHGKILVEEIEGDQFD